MSEDTRLEDAFRAGLQHRADDIDTTVDLVGPAEAAVRGRRRRTWAAGAVGVAAAALVAAVVVQNAGSEPGRGDDPPPVADGPTGPLPTDWRTEAWHGLQVEVPVDWVWGAAPVGSGDELIRCGGPDDASPYVGRPVASSDACQGDPGGPPSAPYVWLGADLDVGDEDLGGGYVQTTVEVEGTTLTVASGDARIRDRVIASAAPVEGCAGDLPSAPVVDSMLMEGMRNPRSAEVCAYAKADTGSYDLVYATTLTKAEAAAYHAQAYDGGFESSPDFCDEGPGDRVLITITGDDPYGGAEVTQATVVDPWCREVSGSPGIVNALSDKGMAAWAKDGLPVSLAGLIGPQG